ncbi:MAG: pilus assembly protein TadG-related protein [Gammaproteobacteria bacterium]|nr:pilus assembly protein TadG-related protein [Gammaproteobacteria bacterium]MDH5275067.1 pilus assembly protein TadG-related protein [Gammaproteobacteria bacterium]
MSHRVHPLSTRPARQGGAIIVLIAIAMLAILAMGGLALDGSHMFLNKARLQNSVDAAALAAAKVLDQTGDEARARTAVTSLLGLNAQAAGNQELNGVLSGGGLNVTVEFSRTLQPFSPGTSPAEYVRVRALNFTMPAWLMRVVSNANKAVGATAVAGPSPTILEACNIVPLVVCGTPPAQGGSAPYWGFQPDQVHVLKSASGQQSPIGPGNFQLLRLGGSGSAVVRENLAGGYNGCFTGGTLPTEPGNSVGPVTQGINTRLNIYSGPMNGTQDTYPPDVVTRQTVPALQYDDTTGAVTQGGQVITSSSQLNFNHRNYQSRVQNSQFDVQPRPNGRGAFERRIMPVPIADCTGSNNGQSDLPILGVGCYFLLQEAVQQGTRSNLFGEFVADCPAGGAPGPNPTAIPGPHIIQLYRDFTSGDS